jgi:hypothetical protein
MNEANVAQTKEIVYRRLSEPFEFFGHELPAELWLVILGLVLLTAFFYVGWMYVKDSRAVGAPWAIVLGLLRSSVYALLAWVFLLRAEQTWEQSQSQAKVIVAFDVSNSLGQVDDIPTGTPGEKLRSRQDKVLEFLTSDRVKFLPNLEATNPVTVFRFATRLDDHYLLFRDGRSWTRAEWEDPNRESPAPGAEPEEPRPLSPEFWTAFLKPAQKDQKGVEDLPAAERARLEKLLARNGKLAEISFANGTNVGDSVLSLVNRELNGRVQGIVVFTDGRSTEGSSQAFRDLEQRAAAAHIPVFVVGVGDERPPVRLEITDVRVPDQVQPEDKFRAVVEVTGEGLDNPQVNVELEVTHTRKVGPGKEQALDITLVEAENPKDSTQKRLQVGLGKKLTLRPAAPAVLAGGPPPRATVEFPIDAQSLAEAAHIDLSQGETAGKKWELGETKDGELHFVARVPRDKKESFQGAFHASEPSLVRVVKKPLRVLLFASAATRDYQFLRTLLVREMEKKRGEVSIFLQLPPGRTERRVGVVQDVEPERLLGEFPNRLEAGKEDKLYALEEYDAIVGFDPDWSKLTTRQLELVRTWVEKGGGLVLLGGPINTLQLARPGEYKKQLEPLLGRERSAADKGLPPLLPVTFRDVRVEDLERNTSDPYPLAFEGAAAGFEFLKLDEVRPDLKVPQDWEEFFYGPRKEGEERGAVQRGFFNFYPVEANPGSVVVARFGDAHAALKDKSLPPYLVVNDFGRGHAVWIGSGETWRLRQFRESYHERFWAKLLRFAGSGNMGKVSKHIRLEMNATYPANKFVEVEAEIDVGVEADGKKKPLPADAQAPEITLTLPDGVPEKEIPTPVLMRPKPGAGGWFAARFQVRSPGNYTLHLKVPATSDTLSRRFVVKEANPEMDNTRPDFDAMYRLAGEADEVLARLGDAERQDLKKYLRRARPVEPGAQNEGKEEKLRLYFDLAGAHLIPGCMRKDVQVHKSRGPIKDQWDEGLTLAEREPPQPPVKVSYVLLGAVGLLSVEWLIRKLLRLA